VGRRSAQSTALPDSPMTSCPRSLPFMAYKMKMLYMSFFPVVTIDVTRSQISLPFERNMRENQPQFWFALP
jgi:hypothetical protein